MTRYSNDPKIITARFESTCKETNKTISKGEKCLYYPSDKSVYKLDTKQHQEFKEWQFDCEVLDRPY